MNWLRRNKLERSAVPQRLRDILHNLGLLGRAEENIATFYARCSRLLPEDAAFWEELAASERGHAAAIHRLAELIAEQPERFRTGETFQPGSVRLFDLFVRGLLERPDLEELPRRTLLELALEIENSAVELDYHQLLSSDHPEFRELVGQICSETQDHRQQLEERLREA